MRASRRSTTLYIYQEKNSLTMLSGALVLFGATKHIGDGLVFAPNVSCLCQRKCREFLNIISYIINLYAVDNVSDVTLNNVICCL